MYGFDANNTRYLIQEDSEVDGNPTMLPVAWGIEDVEEAERIAGAFGSRSSSPFESDATYSIVSYNISNRFAPADDDDFDLGV